MEIGAEGFANLKSQQDLAQQKLLKLWKPWSEDVAR